MIWVRSKARSTLKGTMCDRRVFWDTPQGHTVRAAYTGGTPVRDGRPGGSITGYGVS
jgi:hypothetical protein